jgi:hypothetical protein
MGILISLLFPIAVDLIHKFPERINPLMIEKQMSQGQQTETEERPGDCDDVSQSPSKLLPECPTILDIMSLRIDNGKSNAIPHKTPTSHWLFSLKIVESKADKGSLQRDDGRETSGNLRL